jgi:hypothetical protein
MNICNKPSNKTAPEKSVWTAPAQASRPSPELQGQKSRRNGWSWPPHPLQIVAWLLYLFFAVIGFGVLVPLLPHHWVPAGYAVSLGKWGWCMKEWGPWIDGRQRPEAGLRASESTGWGRAGWAHLLLFLACSPHLTSLLRGLLDSLKYLGESKTRAKGILPQKQTEKGPDY